MVANGGQRRIPLTLIESVMTKVYSVILLKVFQWSARDSDDDNYIVYSLVRSREYDGVFAVDGGDDGGTSTSA